MIWIVGNLLVVLLWCQIVSERGNIKKEISYFLIYTSQLIYSKTMDKQRRKTSIPSANHWRYMLNFQHVPETAKVQKEDVVQLQCRTTHCVCLQQQEYNENDGLYVIYGNRVRQSPEFMREWLHYFITVVYKVHFRRIGSTYLANKELDLELWAESIKDGRHPDFFVLFALNALLETHAVIHINEGKTWIILNDPPENHDHILE